MNDATNNVTPIPSSNPPSGAGEKSKVAAGVLGILLGALGVHKFYLGYTQAGLI
ncbi:MAG TPA: TM2 domain-containing protein, partial [Kiritimatiellia bacterium]|nr:TM2 domain-containing protein [Kiritimatiellia bacterium]HPK69419.1 TM2 domain-containing protein [Kiritimatiellia bacterium]